MYELKFDPAICEKCKTCDCIMKCQYIDMDLETAREEHGKLVRGEDSEILTRCVTCYACEEYCPYHNHPFYSFLNHGAGGYLSCAAWPVILKALS